MEGIDGENSWIATVYIKQILGAKGSLGVFSWGF